MSTILLFLFFISLQKQNKLFILLFSLAALTSCGKGKSSGDLRPKPAKISSVTTNTLNGAYETGNIDLLVTFNQIVKVTGSPRIVLNTNPERYAVYVSGSESDTLLFRYEIQNGDNIARLDYLDSNAFDINNGEILNDLEMPSTLALPRPEWFKDKSIIIDTSPPTNETMLINLDIAYTNSTSVNLDLSADDLTPMQMYVTNTPSCAADGVWEDYDVAKIWDVDAGEGLKTVYVIFRDQFLHESDCISDTITLDTTAPTVLSVVTTKVNGSYNTGNVDIVVTFDEVVNITGSPRITLNTTPTKYAVYESGTGTDTITFRYAIEAGDNSARLDFVNTSSLGLNGGTIKDVATNNATLTLTATDFLSGKIIIIDTTDPTAASAVGAKNLTGDANTDVLNMNVTGPYWFFTAGSDVGGSGLAALPYNLYLYTSLADCTAATTGTPGGVSNTGYIAGTVDGAVLKIQTTGLTNGQTYWGRVLTKDLADNLAFSTCSSGHVIDTTAPTAASSVGAKNLTGDANTDVLNMNVTGPYWFFTAGADVGGSGLAALPYNLYLYTSFATCTAATTGTPGGVSNTGYIAGTVDGAVLKVQTAGLTNGVTYWGRVLTKDLADNLAFSTCSSGHVIDTTAPTVLSVSTTKVNGSYNTGDVDIVVTFDEAVNITNSPRILLNTAPAQYATYNSGTGTTAITFRYSVTAGDTSARLDYVDTSSLGLNTTGTIKDAATNDATLTLTAKDFLGAKTIVIDTTVPYVTGVATTKTTGIYNTGDVDIVVTFSEIVNIANSPRIILNTTPARYATYNSGTGSTTITFRYTVTAGDNSARLDYVDTSSLELNTTGTIKDVATNDATLTLTAKDFLGAKTIVIDTTAPSVSSVSTTKVDGTYNIGNIDITLTFTEAITITNLPRLEMNTNPTRYANYYSGTGTTAIVFRYIIQANDYSAQLDFIDTGSLELNTGTLKDAATNNATLTLPALNFIGGKNIIVDASPYPGLTNGPIHSMVLSGSTLYIGGDFTKVNVTPAPRAIAFDTSTGLSECNDNIFNGSVNVVISDGASGWYVGGAFTTVNGLARGHIARISSTCTLSTFNPNLNGDVYALVLSGGILYAGGDFTSVGADTRYRLAAINIVTGVATAWHPYPDDTVRALKLLGSTLFASGDFEFIGSLGRDYIAAIDTTSASATAWDPVMTSSSSISTMAISDDNTTLYFGGDFDKVNGTTRNNIAAVAVSDASLLAFDPNADDSVLAMTISGSTLYVGGSFDNIGGEVRNGFAAIDTTDSTATAFNPQALSASSSSAAAIVLSGSTVYVAGNFSSIGGAARKNLAALDAGTALATSWDPGPNDNVYSIALSGTKLFAGGAFTSIDEGGETRNHLAAIDTATGTITSFNPNVNGNVNALAISGSTLYAGGIFTSVGGTARNYLASIDTTTGAVTTWDPDLDGYVNALVLSGGTIYAGGTFNNVGVATRNYLAAINTTTGAATAWNPNLNNNVNTLLLSGGTIYAGGTFSTVGAATRNSLAAINTTTGAATAWDANSSGTIKTLALSGSTLYVGGDFTNIGNANRNHVAALNTTSASATIFDIKIVTVLENTVTTIALDGTTLYVGGNFETVGSGGPNEYTRNAIAAFDTATGIATAWDPNAMYGDVRGTIYSILPLTTSVYLGGEFTSLDGDMYNYVIEVAK